MHPSGRMRRKGNSVSPRSLVLVLMLAVGCLWGVFIVKGASSFATTVSEGGAIFASPPPRTSPLFVDKQSDKTQKEKKGNASSPPSPPTLSKNDRIEDCLFFSFGFNKGMTDAWQHFAGEKGKIFGGEPTELSIRNLCSDENGEKGERIATEQKGTLKFWGKSSAKLRLTKRRSLYVTLEGGISLGGRHLKRFVLMSMWEDMYRLAYPTTAAFMESTGVWFPYTKLVTAGCHHISSSSGFCKNDHQFGVYLLIEFPEDAIHNNLDKIGGFGLDSTAPYGRCLREKAGDFEKNILQQSAKIEKATSESVEVGARVWRYHPKPAYYDIIAFPSFASNSSLAVGYKQIAGLKGDSFTNTITKHVDMVQYTAWLALNSLLQNGDYDDEVFFFGDKDRVKKGGNSDAPLLRMHAWDFDTVFEPCHKDGKFALKNEPLLYCAEADIERKIVADKRMFAFYKKALSCILEVHPVEEWEGRIDRSVERLNGFLKNPKLSFSNEIAQNSYEGKTVPDIAAGGSILKKKYADRWNVLASILTKEGLFGTSRGSDIKPLQIKPNEVKEEQISGKCPASINPNPSSHIFLEAKHIYAVEVSANDLQDLNYIAFTPKGRNDVTTFPPGPPASAVKPALFPKGGLYCIPTCNATVVVRGKERGKAEFGVAPFVRPITLFAEGYDVKDIPLSALFGVKDIRLFYPKYLKNGLVPVVVQRIGEDSMWEKMHLSVAGVALPYGFSSMAIPAKTFAGKSFSASCHKKVFFEGSPSSSTVLEADCLYTITKEVVIEKGVTVTIPPGTTFAFSSTAAIHIKGTLIIGDDSGASPETVLFTADGAKQWGGFVVYSEGSLKMSQTMITQTGSKHFKREKNTGSHSPIAPAVTLKEGANVVLDRVFIFDCSGPGFGAAKGASLDIRHSLLQRMPQGGECKLCTFAMKSSAVLDIPNRDSTTYLDEDNDGLYLSGGNHEVHNSVIAFTADDGIDTGTPSSVKKNGGNLVIKDTVIDAVQHEGVAVSGVDRTISLKNVVIRRCQQGVEMGYSSSKTEATVQNCLFQHNAVAIRYGDNYVQPCKGALHVTSSIVSGSLTADVVNVVRKPLGSSTALSISTTHLLSHNKWGTVCSVSNAKYTDVVFGEGGGGGGGGGDMPDPTTINSSGLKTTAPFAFLKRKSG